jgi:hypothetical protein
VKYREAAQPMRLDFGPTQPCSDIFVLYYSVLPGLFLGMYIKGWVCVRHMGKMEEFVCRRSQLFGDVSCPRPFLVVSIMEEFIVSVYH